MMRTPLLLAVAVTTTGCYATKVQAPGAVPVEPEYEHRQWFTLAGLVPLSRPDGEECQTVAESESLSSTTDILISAAFTLGGFVTAYSVCKLPENPTRDDTASYSTCVSAISSIPPLLLTPRTVRYRCAEPPKPPPPVVVVQPPPVPPSTPIEAPPTPPKRRPHGKSKS